MGNLDPAMEIYIAALAMKSRNQNGAAFIHLVTGLSQYPDSEILLRSVAEEYVGYGLFYRSLGFYHKLYDINPDMDLDSKINLSSAYLDMKYYDKAQKLMEEEIEKNPDNHELHFQLGNILEQSMRYKLALQSFRKSNQLNPEFIRSKFGMIRCSLSLGYFKEARELLESLSDNPDAYNFYQEKKQLLDKIEEYQSSLVDIADQMLEFQQGLQDKNLEDTAESWFNRGIQLIAEGNRHIAGYYSGRAFKLRPDLYHYQFVTNILVDEDYHIEEVFINGKLNDNLPDEKIEERLSYIPYYDPHRFEPTRKQANRYAYVELEDIHPTYQSVYRNALQSYQRRDYISAMLSLDYLLYHEPDLGPALLLKARILYFMGRYNETISILYQIFALRSTDPEPCLLAIEVFRILGDHEKVNYYQSMLNNIQKTKVDVTRSNSVFGPHTTRVTQMNNTRRISSKITERYELPRDILNLLAAGFDRYLDRDNSFSEIMFEMVTSYEPNYAEGQLIYAKLKIDNGDYDQAEKSINHILSLDANHKSALLMKKELEEKKEGKEIEISFPHFTKNTYIKKFYYLNHIKF